MVRYIFLFLLGTSAFAQLPTYWGAGIFAADDRGTSGENSFPIFDVNNLGFAASLEFGQLFSPKIGYNIRLASASFRKDLHRDLYYVSGGINYYFSSFNLNANVTYGDFKTQIGFIDDSEPPVEALRINMKRNGAVGYEIGASRNIIGGLWGHAYVHYTPPDRHKVGVSSLQYTGVGVKYLWGRR
jgi:hypothetical protein